MAKVMAKVMATACLGKGIVSTSLWLYSLGIRISAGVSVRAYQCGRIAGVLGGVGWWRVVAIPNLVRLGQGMQDGETCPTEKANKKKRSTRGKCRPLGGWLVSLAV